MSILYGFGKAATAVCKAARVLAPASADLKATIQAQTFSRPSVVSLNFGVSTKLNPVGVVSVLVCGSALATGDDRTDDVSVSADIFVSFVSLRLDVDELTDHALSDRSA
jgi:hypothetical protein